MKVKRGDVVLADLSGAVGVVKKDKRPCLVVLNDRLNRNAPFTVVLPITDRRAWRQIPEQVLLDAAELGRGGKDSVVSAAELRQIDQRQIDADRGVLGHLTAARMVEVDAAIAAAVLPHTTLVRLAEPDSER